MRRQAALHAVVVLWCCATAARADASRGFDHVVIDGVKIPFGTLIEVSGPCIGKDSFELSRGSNRLRLVWRREKGTSLIV